FDLPVRTGVRVDALFKEDGRFVATAGDRRFEADSVVVASGAHRRAHVPAFAAELDPTVVQLHSSEYRNPMQLREGGVLIVGAGRQGLPVREDERVLDAANVSWCTGFGHDLSWIDLPIFGEDGQPVHDRGVARGEPGLCFVGLIFLYSVTSDVLPGVGRDAG